MHTKFQLWHSALGLFCLVVLQAIGIIVLPGLAMVWLTLLAAALGALMLLYVATEVIEDIRDASYMLVLLSVVVSEFVAFFAFQYQFLSIVSPGAFPTLPHDSISVLLHSVMIFVFNPLYMPGNGVGQLMLIINIGGALGLVLFILQNIWQFRK